MIFLFCVPFIGTASYYFNAYFFLDKQEVKSCSSIIVLYDSNDMLSHDLIIKKMRKGIVP